MAQARGLLHMGNRQAQFEALVQAYSADLYRFAFWLCRDRSTAEDLVQETFLRAWRALRALRAEGSAKAWLLRILRNEHARLFRQGRRAVSSEEGEPLESLPDDSAPSVDTAVLRQALERLPDDYREVLLLQVIGGFSAEEIGRMIGASAPAVLTRLFRARRKLRHDLMERVDAQTRGVIKRDELL